MTTRCAKCCKYTSVNPILEHGIAWQEEEWCSCEEPEHLFPLDSEDDTEEEIDG